MNCPNGIIFTLSLLLFLLTDCQQNLLGKYNYYEMKGINVQDSRYVQRSNLDQLEIESEVTEPKRVTPGFKSTIQCEAIETLAIHRLLCVFMLQTSLRLHWQIPPIFLIQQAFL